MSNENEDGDATKESVSEVRSDWLEFVLPAEVVELGLVTLSSFLDSSVLVLASHGCD